MTQEEIETKFATLSARIETLERQRNAQTRHWALCARFALAAAVLLGLLAIAAAVAGILEHKVDPMTQVFGTAMIIALFLGVAFQRAAEAAPPASS